MAAGVKYMLKVVLSPGASVVAPKAPNTNSAEFVPLVVRARPVRSAEPTFFTVNTWLLVRLPTEHDPKSTLVVPSTKPASPGNSTTISGPAAATPFPASVMEKGFSSLSLLVSEIAADRGPTSPGAKAAVNVVLAPGASVVVPRLVRIKSEGFAPTLVKASPVKFAVPAFVTFTVIAPAVLSVPTFPKPTTLAAFSSTV